MHPPVSLDTEVHVPHQRPPSFRYSGLDGQTQTASLHAHRAQRLRYSYTTHSSASCRTVAATSGPVTPIWLYYDLLGLGRLVATAPRLSLVIGLYALLAAYRRGLSHPEPALCPRMTVERLKSSLSAYHILMATETSKHSSLFGAFLTTGCKTTIIGSNAARLKLDRGSLDGPCRYSNHRSVYRSPKRADSARRRIFLRLPARCKARESATTCSPSWWSCILTPSTILAEPSQRHSSVTPKV